MQLRFKILDKKLPLFYSEMLEYFKELRGTYTDEYKSEFILWNNKHITIENKSIFWRDLFERGICFVHDLLDENDNKLREFAFKLYHRILVTNKELKRFKIRNDDACSQCQNADSLEHTFLECPTSIKFYQEILSWFNALENTQINLSKEQFLFQNYTLSPAVHRSIRRRLELSVLFMKKY